MADPVTLTMRVRFRWWVTPLGWLLTIPLMVLGIVTPRRWHAAILTALGRCLAKYGTILRAA